MSTTERPSASADTLTGVLLAGGSVAAFFVAPLGVAAMATPGQQAWLNAIYALVRNRYDDYYADTLNLLCMLVMTRNFWQP